MALSKTEIKESDVGEGKVEVSDLVIGLFCFAILWEKIKARRRRESEIKMHPEWDEVAAKIAGRDMWNENMAIAVRSLAPGNDMGELPPGLMFQRIPA